MSSSETNFSTRSNANTGTSTTSNEPNILDVRSTRGAGKGAGYWKAFELSNLSTGQVTGSTRAPLSARQDESAERSAPGSQAQVEDGGKKKRRKGVSKGERVERIKEMTSFEGTEKCAAQPSLGASGEAMIDGALAAGNEKSVPEKRRKRGVYTTRVEKSGWLDRLRKEASTKGATYQLPLNTVASKYYIPSSSVSSNRKHPTQVSFAFLLVLFPADFDRE